MIFRALGQCRRGSKTGNLGVFRCLQCMKTSLEAPGTGSVEDTTPLAKDIVMTHLSHSTKTVDKSGLDFSTLKRMSMDKPPPGVPPLKHADEIEVNCT